MDNRPRHDEFREELARRGLPRAYVERLVAELDDHLTDLIEERSTSMAAARKLQSGADDANTFDVEQRLGEPTQLAIFAAEQYHARSFWGRHPWLTYLVMPLPLLILSAITFSTALIAAGQVLSFICIRVFGVEEPANPADYLLLQGVALGISGWYMLVVPPLVSGLVLCRIYRRNALDWRWPVVGCGILSLACAFVTISYQVATEPGNGMFTIGFFAATSMKWILTSLLPKFALAMGIGLLLIKRAQHRMTLGPVGIAT
jgi:hypothetical protein